MLAANKSSEGRGWHRTVTVSPGMQILQSRYADVRTHTYPKANGHTYFIAHRSDYVPHIGAPDVYKSHDKEYLHPIRPDGDSVMTSESVCVSRMPALALPHIDVRATTTMQDMQKAKQSTSNTSNKQQTRQTARKPSNEREWQQARQATSKTSNKQDRPDKKQARHATSNKHSRRDEKQARQEMGKKPK